MNKNCHTPRIKKQDEPLLEGGIKIRILTDNLETLSLLPTGPHWNINFRITSMMLNILRTKCGMQNKSRWSRISIKQGGKYNTDMTRNIINILLLLIFINNKD